MGPDRREFLKFTGWLSASGVGIFGAGEALANTQGKAGHATSPADPMGVLVDLTVCNGCRTCEHACKEANGFEAGPLSAYDDQSIFREQRRPAPDALTVVNAYRCKDSKTDKPVYAKVNCMHCDYPACASACIVGALRKQDNGAVTYDAWKCIGCRYCMVACPFQIPAYEYDNAFTPQVRKCEFCTERTAKGELPACVHACPQHALNYGKRSDLLAQAHTQIAAHPDRYVDHVYGEHEVGGTSWLYLAPVPFEQAGFLKVGNIAPPALTEAIQHGVFKHWIAPVGWYSFLCTAMWWTGRRAKSAQAAEQSHQDEHAHAHTDRAAPVKHKLLTPGVWALIAMVAVGALFWCYRMVVGLGATTNLDQQHPWGLWIAMDVGSGIALAGGGFMTAAIAHVFHRQHYHAIARSALLTALLGYTFYVPGLLADIGRWYNIWHPNLPSMWQGNSVLFEVGICVMIYLTVQYAEITPIVCERILKEKWGKPWIARWAGRAQRWLTFIMPSLLCLGVCLSTFHQSSLGNLMVIAPYKVHPLWWTPMSPLFFLLSAAMVGFPVVIFTILFASWCLHRRPEMNILSLLARYIPVFLSLYLAVKLGDLYMRGTYVHLFSGEYEGVLWLVEILFGVIAPLILLLLPSVRRSPTGLAIATLAVILGVVLNRLNVFVLAYHPPYATKTYFPSVTEFAVSMGLVAGLLLTYRIAVTYLPILEPPPPPEGSEAPEAPGASHVRPVLRAAMEVA